MRVSNISRETKETCVSVRLTLEGGKVEISTGIGFLTICSPPWPFTAVWG